MAFLALLLDHLVAFAGGTFPLRPVDDVDLPALVSNQSGLLQRTGGNGDAGPASMCARNSWVSGTKLELIRS
ncbi:MAG TPA: hypothetical protein VK513_05265 [Terriglobales bacterium]|nr:hypothetical protein [Terriglobales bacterium]